MFSPIALQLNNPRRNARSLTIEPSLPRWLKNFSPAMLFECMGACRFGPGASAGNGARTNRPGKAVVAEIHRDGRTAALCCGK